METLGTMLNLNGLKVHRVKDTLFVALPPELWRRASTDNVPCSCNVCKADKTGGCWDTLAVAVNPGRKDDRSYVVHYPELHAEHNRKRMAY